MNEVLSEDQRAIIAMRTLALVDPDYPAFVAGHPQLAHASVSANVESHLEREVLHLLQQLPDRAAQLERMKQVERRVSFDGGVATVPILLVAAFLLRTHIRFERDNSGKWRFLAEHKPADSKLVTQLLAKIVQLLSHD
jgi:hypothetical protein